MSLIAVYYYNYYFFLLNYCSFVLSLLLTITIALKSIVSTQMSLRLGWKADPTLLSRERLAGIDISEEANAF